MTVYVIVCVPITAVLTGLSVLILAVRSPSIVSAAVAPASLYGDSTVSEIDAWPRN